MKIAFFQKNITRWKAHQAQVASWFWSKLWRRFGLVCIRTCDKKAVYRHLHSNKETVRASLVAALHQRLEFKNADLNEEVIAHLAERVIAHIEHRESLSLKDHLEKYHPEIIGNRILVLQMAFGVMCHWEMEVLNLSKKLDINLYSEKTFDDETLEMRTMRDIIKDIDLKCPHLKLNLNVLRQVRNAVVHSNFHQLLNKAKKLPGSENISFDSGSLMMLNLKTGETASVYEKQGFDEFQEVDHFGWLLASAGQDLMEFLIQHFRKSSEDLATLIHFHDLAHTENEILRDHVFRSGRIIDESDLGKFISANAAVGRSETWSRGLVDRVNSLLQSQ